ncbi:MAG TPA: DUF5329 family protein [Geothrix sp.]|uniref:DUF5329 family protein n=1 Tax=Geothrix mesophila TaxID=2922723 RepID=UPI001FAD5819|nr:DUF5329 family protein [Geothrix sp. SG198]HJV37598.1 DUF5329 family protein [Geothrix sp.]
MPIVLLAQAPAPETQKIETLIKAIEALQGQALFLRNGSEHDAKAAGDHLRLKWKNAGKRVQSAADFIRYCGTGSSLSGQPYRIRYKDGREVASADFLWTELKKLDPSIK